MIDTKAISDRVSQKAGFKAALDRADPALKAIAILSTDEEMQVTPSEYFAACRDALRKGLLEGADKELAEQLVGKQ